MCRGSWSVQVRFALMADPGSSERSWRTFWLDEPAGDAPRHTRITYMRDMQLRLLVMYIPLGLSWLLLGTPRLLAIILAVGFAWSLLWVAHLTLKAARARRDGQ